MAFCRGSNSTVRSELIPAEEFSGHHRVKRNEVLHTYDISHRELETACSVVGFNCSVPKEHQYSVFRHTFMFCHVADGTCKRLVLVNSKYMHYGLPDYRQRLQVKAMTGFYYWDTQQIYLYQPQHF